MKLIKKILPIAILSLLVIPFFKGGSLFVEGKVNADAPINTPNCGDCSSCGADCGSCGNTADGCGCCGCGCDCDGGGDI